MSRRAALLTLLAVLLVFPIICILVWNAGLFLGEQQIRNSQVTWENSEIADYLITVESQGMHPDGRAIVTVADGQVVAVDSDSCNPCSLETYQQFTVPALFDSAIRCGRDCVVTLNSTYNYPEFLTLSGTILQDNFSIKVINFQPISSE